MSGSRDPANLRIDLDGGHITHAVSEIMAKKTQTPDSKVEALRRQGCLHPHPERVTDPRFIGSDFFDARDLAQVKYEMPRAPGRLPLGYNARSV